MRPAARSRKDERKCGAAASRWRDASATAAAPAEHVCAGSRAGSRRCYPSLGRRRGLQRNGTLDWAQLAARKQQARTGKGAPCRLMIAARGDQGLARDALLKERAPTRIKILVREHRRYIEQINIEDRREALQGRRPPVETLRQPFRLIEKVLEQTPRSSAARRCSHFHMWHPSVAIRVPHKESQTIHPTQQLSGSALRKLPD